jgi:hypothetical protein
MLVLKSKAWAEIAAAARQWQARVQKTVNLRVDTTKDRGDSQCANRVPNTNHFDFGVEEIVIIQAGQQRGSLIRIDVSNTFKTFSMTLTL